MKTVLITIATLAVLLVAGVAVFLYSGIYNVAATQQHAAFTYWLIDTVSARSVKTRAEDIEVPDLTEAGLVEAGLQHYREHCVWCHGAPGVPPRSFAMGMTPVPPYLVQTAREWTPGEIYWTVKNGIKMTGMPGWDFKLEDEEIWAIVAFLMQLPRISPADYQVMIGGPGEQVQPVRETAR